MFPQKISSIYHHNLPNSETIDQTPFFEVVLAFNLLVIDFYER